MTTFKSFQIAVLFHLLLGLLLVFFISIENKNQNAGLQIQKKILINLTSLKIGTFNRQNTGIFDQKKTTNNLKLEKNNFQKVNETNTDSLSEFDEKKVGNGGSASGTSFSGADTGYSDSGSSDFNQSILHYSEPLYPNSALRRGLQGTLKVRILVGIQGIPIEIQILQSSGHKVLDESALEAIRKWVFKSMSNSPFHVVKTIIFQIKN